MNNNKIKVLVTFVEAGMGHIVSALSISEELKQTCDDKYEIIDSYILRDSDNELLREYEKFLIKNVQGYGKYPLFGYVQNFAMYLIGPQKSLKFVHSTVFRKQVDALVEEFAKANPDVIICTHYFISYCAVKYRNKHNKNVKVITYCPDNNVHGWWDLRSDMFYTNNDLATMQAYDMNFKSGCVKTVFYPVRSAVREVTENKSYYREKYGIPQDKFTVLVADGMYACAKSKSICQELIETDLPMTVCLLAGKNEEIKQEFDELIPKVKSNVTLKTFGFVQNAPELYKACDLFVTKGGPNAILECVMMDTPIIVSFCATPIEHATMTLFVKHFHCGEYLTEPRKIREKVEEFVKNPALLEEYAESVNYFDKNKNGALEIANDLQQLMLSRHMHRAKRFAEEDIEIDKYVAMQTEEKTKRYKNELSNEKLKANSRAKLSRKIQTIRYKCVAEGINIKHKLHSGKGSRKYAHILAELSAKNGGHKTLR